MLSCSDVEIKKYFPTFSNTGVNVTFLVPTETGFKKSIMDATSIVRTFLKDEGIHDYIEQEQGPNNKKIITTFLVNKDLCTKTITSLYRPITKKGDPRIWIYGLKGYCIPGNLLAIISIEKELYIINLSNAEISDSLFNNGYVYDVLLRASDKKDYIFNELIDKIKKNSL